ncbi:hypothetical protein A2773_03265 [Candidatus Gottesmanbacteria bacterium RIFCSPHIGHO2_01_FULL_39_10]|uniref:2'-5' RNA ligase n=1 Tax=Candidatus Gottesmanbacteria bacterium RIFCSPHIGHO2_01_FULL_39_10 TaxID=1798375 RepID=A0A1F5ZLY6_9BACT|nr:MAG: hypothetical protein A2773_03265 [Candidatus Gottesmanbacteria bacterium RIFCSPHIGHO2_01_FULL_39_10]
MAESVIIVPVLTAEPIVGKWRKKYDPVALHGIPAHITLLYPFLNPAYLTSDILDKLGDIFFKTHKFSFALTRIDTFPGVVYLEPDPKENFIQITQTLVKNFPANPAYSGKYPEIHPHLTLAQLTNNSDTDRVEAEIAADVLGKLPLTAVAEEAWLMVKEDVQWTLKREFSFL